MRFAFHFLGCATVDSNGLRVRGPLGIFADALASHVEHLDLLLDEKVIDSADGIESQTDYYIRSSNISWISLGPNGGANSFTKRIATMRRHLPAMRKNWDFVLFREPSRRSPFIRWWLGNTPTVYLLGADYTNNMSISRGLFAYARARFFTSDLRSAARSSLVFVNNEVLLEKWAPYARAIHLTRTSTIDVADLVLEPIKRFTKRPYKLLFVGRVEPLKGVEFLLEALATLNSSTPLYRLSVVGSGSAKYLAHLRQKASNLGVDEHVDWIGYQTRDKILRFYHDSDCFVLPTLVENLARAIWEAMSQSCPVITTQIGGQGIFFQHERDLLFCETHSSQALVEQISRLANDPRLCQQIITSGLNLVKQNTVQIRSQELIQTVAQYLHDIKR